MFPKIAQCEGGLPCEENVGECWVRGIPLPFSHNGCLFPSILKGEFDVRHKGIEGSIQLDDVVEKELKYEEKKQKDNCIFFQNNLAHNLCTGS